MPEDNFIHDRNFSQCRPVAIVVFELDILLIGEPLCAALLFGCVILVEGLLQSRRNMVVGQLGLIRGAEERVIISITSEANYIEFAVATLL